MRASRKHLLLTLVVASSLAFAQQSNSFRACSQNAKSQTEMNSCANQEATRSQDELARTYKKLLAKTSGQPEAAEKIKAAEKAWRNYRDAYLDAMYPASDKQSQYGTIYPMNASLLRANLTRQHISDLKKMLRQYNEGE